MPMPNTYDGSPILLDERFIGSITPDRMRARGFRVAGDGNSASSMGSRKSTTGAAGIAFLTTAATDAKSAYISYPVHHVLRKENPASPFQQGSSTPAIRPGGGVRLQNYMGSLSFSTRLAIHEADANNISMFVGFVETTANGAQPDFPDALKVDSLITIAGDKMTYAYGEEFAGFLISSDFAADKNQPRIVAKRKAAAFADGSKAPAMADVIITPDITPELADPDQFVNIELMLHESGWVEFLWGGNRVASIEGAVDNNGKAYDPMVMVQTNSANARTVDLAHFVVNSHEPAVFQR